MGAPEITAFLSWLATRQHVSASTQNQALSALLFLYRHVLHVDVGPIEPAARGKMPHRVPVVLSREEVGAVFKNIEGTMWVVVALLYGAGLRLQECLELRVKEPTLASDGAAVQYQRYAAPCASAVLMILAISVGPAPTLINERIIRSRLAEASAASSFAIRD